MLRLPRDMSRAEKEERVSSIISELGLRDVQDTNVGNENVRGVSGGERKRGESRTRARMARCLLSPL
jgi:ABC-type multidrug transport system ATPase subunit